MMGRNLKTLLLLSQTFPLMSDSGLWAVTEETEPTGAKVKEVNNRGGQNFDWFEGMAASFVGTGGKSLLFRRGQRRT